jgi:dTDP-4-dehydrorhamnose 3,5-epimerase
MNQRLDFIETPLQGLYQINHKLITDQRGFFNRLFCAQEFKEAGLTRPIAQINHTLTKKKGAIRGMHFQYPPWTETKIVTCIHGEVFDVAVDMREKSPTYLQWHAEILSEKNHKSFYIPDGFAHGFQTLTDNCQLLYFHSEFFEPEAEGGVNAMDSKLAIQWPQQVTEISERDKNHPMLGEMFEGINIV